MRPDTHHNRSSSAAPIEPAHESVPLAPAPPGFVVAPHVRHSSTAARRAALFFFIAGVLAIVDSILLPAAQAQELTFIALGLLDLAIADEENNIYTLATYLEAKGYQSAFRCVMMA